MEKTQKDEFSIGNIIRSFENWPQIFKFIWNIDKRFMFVMSFLCIIQGVIPTLSIVVTQKLINAIQAGTKDGGNSNNLFMCIVLYVIISVSAYVTDQLRSYFESIFQLRITYKTDMVVIEKAGRLQLKDYENSDIHDMLRRAQNDSGSRIFRTFSQILGVIASVISLVSTSMLLIAWKWWIVIVVLIVPIISSVYSIKIGNEQYKIVKERAQEQRRSWYISYLLTNEISFKEIRLYNLTEYFINKFRKINKKFVSQDKRIIYRRTRLDCVFGFLGEVIGAVVIYLIVQAAYVGEILIGDTISYIRCISSVQGTTSGILESLVGIYNNNLYMNLFFDFINLPEAEEHIGRKVINEINVIELKNVSYKYNGRNEYAVKNINLVVKKGETTAFVGHNGSGKTTLVKIICGFYDNYEGEIYVNGINLKEIDIMAYRKCIGAVFQDFSKYELTLRENVAVGNLEKVDDDNYIREAVCSADGDDIINDLSGNIDSQLGVWFDSGVQLSGGQWQKIALSRAFLRNTDTYILDEPSSALDPIAEHNMLSKSAKLIKGKIGIFITHRLFTVKRIADRVIVLKGGEIIERGTHDELMKDKGYYYELYNMQNADDKIEVLEVEPVAITMDGK